MAIRKGGFLPAAAESRFNTRCRIISLAGTIALGVENPESRRISMTVPPSLVQFEGVDGNRSCTTVEIIHGESKK